MLNDSDIVEAFDIKVLIAHEPIAGLTTVTLLLEREDGLTDVVVGGAKRNPTDDEDAEIGKNLAFARALAQLTTSIYDPIRIDVEG